MNVAQQMASNSDHEWEKFLSNISEYAGHSAEKWTAYTLLAYFLQRYREINDVDFIFSFSKRGPTHSRELKQASKIWEMFNQGRYAKLSSKEEKLAYKEQLVAILKQYVDWGFSKFRGKQTNVTGLGLFAVANFMNEFLQWRRLNKKVLPRRSDPIPAKLMSWIEANAKEVLERHQLTTLESLNHLLNYVEEYDPNHATIDAAVLKMARELSIMPKEGRLELAKK